MRACRALSQGVLQLPLALPCRLCRFFALAHQLLPQLRPGLGQSRDISVPLPNSLAPKRGYEPHSSQHQCLDRVHGPGPGLGSQRKGMGFVSAFCSETSTQQMTRPNCICSAARIFQPFGKTKKACQAGGSRGCFLSPAILDFSVVLASGVNGCFCPFWTLVQPSS